MLSRKGWLFLWEWGMNFFMAPYCFHHIEEPGTESWFPPWIMGVWATQGRVYAFLFFGLILEASSMTLSRWVLCNWMNEWLLLESFSFSCAVPITGAMKARLCTTARGELSSMTTPYSFVRVPQSSVIGPSLHTLNPLHQKPHLCLSISLLPVHQWPSDPSPAPAKISPLSCTCR